MGRIEIRYYLGVKRKMKAKAVLEREHRNHSVLRNCVPKQYPAAAPARFAGSGQELFGVHLNGKADEFGPKTDSRPAMVQPAYNWFRNYDGKGKVIEEGLYAGDGLPVFRWVYIYSDSGNKIEANLYNTQRSLRVRCLYDEEETLVKRLIYKNGCCNEEINYEYDGATKFLGSLVQRADGSISHTAHLRM